LTMDWTGFVALIGALLTLFASILALLPLLVNRTENITAPLDPKIKAIKIKRNALMQEDWERRRRRIIISYIYIILYLLIELMVIIVVVGMWQRFVATLNVLFPFGFLGASTLKIFAVFFIIYPLITILLSLKTFYLRSPSELRFKYAEDAKYYIFKNVEIEVEGNIVDIFCKAQEALQGKKGQQIDVDFDAKTLDMCLKGSYIVNKAPVKIGVEVKPSMQNAKYYLLEIEYKREGNKPAFDSRYKWIDLRTVDVYSAIINQFIGLFLTTRVSSGDKINRYN
jgi:hypothetical protein